jgi:hypothetical protein
MELSPEEDMTMSVSANDFGDSVEAGVCVVGKPWLPVCDCNEAIPNIPIQELGPTLF